MTTSRNRRLEKSLKPSNLYSYYLYSYYAYTYSDLANNWCLKIKYAFNREELLRTNIHQYEFYPFIIFNAFTNYVRIDITARIRVIRRFCLRVCLFVCRHENLRCILRIISIRYLFFFPHYTTVTVCTSYTQNIVVCRFICKHHVQLRRVYVFSD